MALPHLNLKSPVPLYQQLVDFFGRKISEGEYAAGDRLPSEPSLVRALGVGRPTIRQATDVLVQRGLVERRRGSGTFVRAPKRAVDLFSLSGTTAAFQQCDVPVVSEWLGPVVYGLCAQAEGQAFAGRECYQLQRLSLVEGRPLLLEEFYLDAEVFPNLERFSLNGRSLSKIVELEYFAVPTGAEQTFVVTALESERAARLKMEVGAAVLLVRRALNFEGRPGAIYTELFCRTDEFAFSQTLGRT